MQAILRTQGIVTVIDIAGRLRLEDGVDEFRAVVGRLVGEGQPSVVLNMAACSYVDSAGLGELATALVKVRKAGGQLVLLNPTDRVHELLRVTRLGEVFTIHRDEQAAVQAVQPT